MTLELPIVGVEPLHGIANVFVSGCSFVTVMASSVLFLSASCSWYAFEIYLCFLLIVHQACSSFWQCCHVGIYVFSQSAFSPYCHAQKCVPWRCEECFEDFTTWFCVKVYFYKPCWANAVVLSLCGHASYALLGHASAHCTPVSSMSSMQLVATSCN